MDTRQKARELKQECEQLLAGAEAEGRSLTAEEQGQYDSKFSELESALATIKRADQLAVVSAGLAEPATPSVGPVAATDPEQTRDSESVEVAVLKDRNAERGFNHIGEQLQAIAFASHSESAETGAGKMVFPAVSDGASELKWSIISFSVRSSLISLPLTCGKWGSCSCRDHIISTRLIESIPRSASRSIPSSSISAG